MEVDQEKGPPEDRQQWKTEKDTELRLEIPEGKGKAELVLLKGQGEVFGTELIKNKKFTFNAGSKLLFSPGMGALWKYPFQSPEQKLFKYLGLLVQLQ
ncbi:Cleavage polyadenylation factor subunit clp1 [Desmophyllum pertusum]|uniref:Cleavage polyadenylation factor subunit clp1 n=1 Tax=Desmophyllum pertusum TaxID=174260 RepID=A0A9X0D2H4_9CNID|nr:Cleavage polyadenylation factor subunit clp1 [Desmophyllum pertusum]